MSGNHKEWSNLQSVLQTFHKPATGASVKPEFDVAVTLAAPATETTVSVSGDSPGFVQALAHQVVAGLDADTFWFASDGAEAVELELDWDGPGSDATLTAYLDSGTRETVPQQGILLVDADWNDIEAGVIDLLVTGSDDLSF